MNERETQAVQSKPRLLFFQYKYNANLPEFSLRHKIEHVRCLAEFFEVSVIDEDCDYRQICDKHQPDVTLFESGLNLANCRRPKVTNNNACSEIPKLGLINADSWCETRAGTMSDMEHLGIETFFSICTTAAEHTPEIAENLFVWPNFIDPETYRDYGQVKVVPVLLTGATSALYPWRRRIYKLVSEHYPSLICPHRGYYARSGTAQTIYGEQYARAINSSWCVPTCGTVAKEVVRKHFEVPGCKACLITEKSPGLEAAGFVDMQNCVFAEESDILDKLAYLFENPAELDRIIAAGYQLVHSRHTLRQRDQIFQWFKLHQKLKGNEKIVQNNPFEPLSVVEKPSGVKNCYVRGNGLHLALLRQADERLWAGKLESAERLYLRCSNLIRWMPEPRVRLALCSLYKGNTRMALHWILGPLKYTLLEYKAADPDPVEWAYLIICLLCAGKLDKAAKLSAQFSWLRHPELDRTRWAISILKEKRTPVFPGTDSQRHLRSVHILPMRSLDEWVEQLCKMVKACGQCDLAETLKKNAFQIHGSFFQHSHYKGTKKISASEECVTKGRPELRMLVSGKRAGVAFVKNRWIYEKMRSKVSRRGIGLFNRLEAAFGYFLPYDVSEKRNHEFFQAIQKLMREEEIKTVLLIEVASGEGSTEAFLTGMMEAQIRPQIFCINTSTSRFVRLEKRFWNHPSIKCYRIASNRREQIAEELEKGVGEIKRKNKIDFFDVVFVGGSQFNIRRELSRELYAARFVLLNDINRLHNNQIHHRMLRDPSFVLVAENPNLSSGFSIFKRDVTGRYARVG